MSQSTLDALGLPLFVPGHRPDRYAKAAAAGADAIIIDLEDAVPAEAKAEARGALQCALASAAFAVPVLVRVNAAGTPWHEADLAVCAELPLAAIMLPKAETATGVAHAAVKSGHPVLALIETARGLRAIDAITEAATRLAFGSIDYAADIGADHVRESLLFARSTLVVAARAADRPPPLDGVTVAINDAEALAGDCRHARALGMGGKLLIHPAQIPGARQAFAPGAEEIAWARTILAATASADGGVVKVDGAMVDPPVIKRAEQIMRRAEADAK